MWGQSPGPEENRDKKEFIGKSGKFLWAELARVGIEREMCDIQNSVRCFPADYDNSGWPPLRMRNPTKEEIHCCSVYNRAAMQRSEAKLHLIFGEIAAKSVLGNEYDKRKKIFWSEKIGANVVCLYHPSFFLRQGYSAEGGPAPNKFLKQFRSDLTYASTLIKSAGRFAYIKKQHYVDVTDKETAKAAYKRIKWLASKGRRVAVDIEVGVLIGKEARKAVLCCGFSPAVGEAYVFALDATTGVDITREARRYNWEVVRDLWGDETVRKVLHHGSSDAYEMADLIGEELRGYDYDTEFGEYFMDCDAKAYGLVAIADRRFPEFVGYKEMIAPEVFTESFAETAKKSKLSMSKLFDQARKKGAVNYAQIPWPKLYIYNGADCDLTKRVEVSTKKSCTPELMHLYRDAGILLAKMEKQGPLMDYRHQQKLYELYPVRVRRWQRELRKIAKDEKFGPGSPQQVHKLLFEDLGLELPEGFEDNTSAETLEAMEDQHDAVGLVLKYRRDAKILSTYLDGFKRSADMHEGMITTKWWLTGTRTGRLSSGASQSKEPGLVNLQNVVNDGQLQNMIVSSLEWRELYKAWKRDGPFTDESWRQFEDIDVLLGFDEAQFEIRVVAQRSGDKELIATFERDEDIHAEVGFQLLGVSKESLMEEGPERVSVKGMHFGLVYGLKAKALQASIIAEYRRRGIKAELPTLEWVQDLMDKYFAKYAAVARMIENDHKNAEELGYVETMFGFRRHLNVEEQKALGDAWKGAYWKNQAANTPIQGTAHQLLLLGLAQLVRKPEEYKLLQRAKMEVHDAMYFYVKLKNIWKAIVLGQRMLQEEPVRAAREEFELNWKVPLKAEPKAGFRFGVQVKNLGMKKGPKTTAEFLNQWCEKNQKLQTALSLEMGKNKAVA